MNAKRKLRIECDKLFKEVILFEAAGRCEVCGSSFGTTAHHFIPRSLAGHLIHYLPNGVCLCQSCHFSHHTKDDPAIDRAIIQKRGNKWFLGLMERRKEKHYSYQTLGYYQETKMNLQNNIDKLNQDE